MSDNHLDNLRTSSDDKFPISIIILYAYVNISGTHHRLIPIWPCSNITGDTFSSSSDRTISIPALQKRTEFIRWSQLEHWGELILPITLFNLTWATQTLPLLRRSYTTKMTLRFTYHRVSQTTYIVASEVSNTRQISSKIFLPRWFDSSFCMFLSPEDLSNDHIFVARRAPANCYENYIREVVLKS